MNSIDFSFTSGLMAIGGRTVRQVVPFLKKVREQFDDENRDFTYACLDSFFSESLKEEFVNRPTYVELLVDDPLLDPRAPSNSRSTLFTELLQMQRHCPLVVVAPVTYRNFEIGGEEPKVLKRRLVRRIYNSARFGIECRKSVRGSGNLVAYVYDFATRVPMSWVMEDTYDEEEEWFRACGDCACSTCGKTYREHPRREIFHELCNGQLVKL